MKRLNAINGYQLILVLLVSLLIPKTISAVPYPDCNLHVGLNPAMESIIEEGGPGDPLIFHLPPISDYTREVIERTEKGILYAKSNQKNQTFTNNEFSNWLSKAYQAYAKILDTEINVIMQERELYDVTSCLNVDIILIETQMERARCALQWAVAEKRHNSITMLAEVIEFLLERYDALLKGARDNTYSDSGWFEIRNFDPPGYKYQCANDLCVPVFNPTSGTNYSTLDVCQVESGCPIPKKCPFHSTYLPPVETQSGSNIFVYGCDITVTGNYATLPTFEDSPIPEVFYEEYRAFQRIMSERTGIIADAENVKTAYEQIDAWMGRTPPEELENFGSLLTANRIHKERVGCSLKDYPNTSQPIHLPRPDDQGIYPTTVNYEDVWPPTWPDGAIRWETHGPFSFEKNNLRLLREYFVVRESWGKKRPLWYNLPPYLGLSYFFQLWIRGEIKQWDVHQERLTSASVTHATDASRQTVMQFDEVRKAMSEFSGIVNHIQPNDTIRGFTRNLAYFLRRTCIDRPCNDRLELVLKIIFKDECFPYTTGGYKDEEMMKKCGD